MDKDTPAGSKGKSTQGAPALGHNTSGKANDGEHVSLKMTETQWNDKFKAAADENNDKTVEELLRKRPIVHTGRGSKEHKDSDKDVVVAALFDAIRRGQVPMVKTIIRSKEFKWGHRYGDLERTALHEAVDAEKEDIVRELLRHSESAKYIDLGDAYRRTALHIAASKGNRVIMKCLLSNQAGVDARDHQKMSPLHMAVWENSSNLDKYRDAVKLLLENGAKVNTRDQSRDSPLHEAARNADENIMRLLLQYGADPDCINGDGHTPQYLVQNHAAKRIFYEPRNKWLRKEQEIPESPSECSPKQQIVCDQFFVNVRFYWRRKSLSWAQTVSVHDVLYGGEHLLNEFEERFIEIIKESEKGSEVRPEDIWKWFHFPANNMTWIMDLIWRVTRHLSPEQRRHSWSFVQRNINEQEDVNGAGSIRMHHAEFWGKDDEEVDNEGAGVGTKADGEQPQGVGEQLESESWRNTTRFSKGRKLSLVLPYIDFETEQYLARLAKKNGKWDSMLKTSYKMKAAFINSETRQYLENLSNKKDERVHFTETWHFKRMNKLERHYPPYNGLSGLQVPRTLDGSYYNILSPNDLMERDIDQAIYKWFIHYKSGKHKLKTERRSKIKRVYEDLVFSEDSEVESDTGEDEIAKVKTKIAPAKKGHATVNTADLAKLLMIHQLWLWKIDENTVITALPERWHTGLEDTLFDTIRQSGINSFKQPEDLISHIVFECVTFLDKFRDAGLGGHILDIYENCIARRSNHEMQCFREFQNALQKQSSLNSIQREMDVIYEVKDIRDELHLVRQVFEDQLEVVDKISKIIWSPSSMQAKQFVEDCAVDPLIRWTEGLDNVAKRALEDLDYLVQVKQAQSSLDQAEAAGKLNNFILLLTIVTIIFTPLSFMTSLFAVSISQFPHDTTGSINYDSSWITGRMFAGELTSLFVVLAIAICLFWPAKLQVLWRCLLQCCPCYQRRVRRQPIFLECQPRISGLGPGRFSTRRKRDLASIPALSIQESPQPLMSESGSPQIVNKSNTDENWSQHGSQIGSPKFGAIGKGSILSPRRLGSIRNDIENQIKG